MSYDASERSTLSSRRRAQHPPEHAAASSVPPDPDTTSSPDTAARAAASAGWLANLRQRIGSAALLIALIIAMLFCGGWIAFAGALVFLCLGAWEMSAMLARRGWRPQMLISIALGADFLLAAMFPQQRLLIISGGISGSVILSFTTFLMAGESFENALRDWALTLAIPLYLGWPLALLIALRGPAFGLGSTGFWWTLAIFAMVWGNDTGAYLTGHFFGKTKLAPRISPAKTWEGFAGGLAVSIIGAFVFSLALHLPWYASLTMGAFTAIAATLGDLAESMLKRGAGVKDSGQLIPGHGGVLDRMDSLLFAVMVVVVYAAIFDTALLR
ncbi:MAG TPA: phosphatidate cytidylyltransferase [Ktedonobacterales bacterium]|jgi:phosphatidate cytidylyltransferase|nr:phosphatidate cytidylyltransferase [Ktedonobacterales bacterium]